MHPASADALQSLMGQGFARHAEICERICKDARPMTHRASKVRVRRKPLQDGALRDTLRARAEAQGVAGFDA